MRLSPPISRAHPRLLRGLFLTALVLNAVVSVVVVQGFHIPVSTEIDSLEYIRTADNVVTGHGFSIETTPPWQPNAFRTPGPLLLNIPLRAASFGNDLAAVIINRVVLLAAALLVIELAIRLGLSAFAWLAGMFFVWTPTMAYYSLLPYSTETAYAVACGLLFAASATALTRGGWDSVTWIGLAALYALSLRPAALFMLIAYSGVGLLLALVSRQHARRRLLMVSGSCLLGVLVAYASWSYRNYHVFGSFRYSSIGGASLLHYSARAMQPYLDETGQQELKAALARNPVFLQRYSGPDQFAVSEQQAREGMRLMLRYPVPFLESHLAGVLRSSYAFSPKRLEDRSRALVVAPSIIHSGLALLGVIGLVACWASFATPQKYALALILTAGVVSTLTGGALGSPRFRIPLDALLAVGCALFVMRLLGRELVGSGNLLADWRLR